MPSIMADAVAEHLVEVTGCGVSVENMSVDTFSLDDIAEPEIKTIKAYVSTDTDMPALLEQIDLFLQQEGKIVAGYRHRPPAVAALPNEDWTSGWKRNFKPVRIGNNIVIKPSWEPYGATDSDIIVEIDPGMAFGTGTHATTRLCLQALEKIALGAPPYSRQAPALGRLLDVGTGSGILAVAAVKLGATGAVGIDIDPEAVSAAEDNFRLNNVFPKAEASLRPLHDISEVFHVVVANILAEDLARMAEELLQRVEKGGWLVLSGILTEREPVIETAFSSLPVAHMETLRDGEWSLISFRRTD